MNRLLPVAILAFLTAQLGLVAAQDLRPLSALHGPVPVVDVVDGDTLVVASDLGPRTVRLIGIDTPEIGDGAEALSARERLNALVHGRPVWVELGSETQDRYARLLAYLYVEDPTGAWDLGGVRATQVNLAMVEAGWADTLTIPPNTAYEALYAEAKAAAMGSGRGLWAERRQDADAAAAGPDQPRPGGTPGGPRLHCALVNPSTPNDTGAEWVSVMLAEAHDTTGYYLWDEGSKSTFRLPSGVQSAGEVRVTNPGQGVWNNSGDTIYLMRGGEVVDSWTYGRELAVEDRVACRDPQR